MLITFTKPRVVIRPTLPSDTPDVLEFCKHIWDGHDYIPYVWDEWMADPTDLLFTAEYAGHAVGIARIAHVAPKQWWLEGLRVNQEFQDKKIGSALHEYLTEWWLEKGDGTVRLWTNAKRVKVHHLCEKLGFIHTQERVIYAAPPLDEPENSFVPVADQEISAAVAFSLASPALPFIGGFMDGGWRISVPHEIPMRELLRSRDGRLLWWRERQGLVCLWEDEDEIGLPMVSLAVCAIADLPFMLQDLRRQSAREGKHKIAWNVNLSPELIACLVPAGFSRESDDSNYQFEKIHPSRP
jgi:GNAT superfamily N-acetyltransferase